ncbi:uncharacterized protein LOC133836049 [Drosophila sulfurigaster albostrigata]|uniref:uncharacterized protein LOC133836049 n=1 Tax=Drosophila sulfurigaster albostrigata TaxID=89887 RepID=UPI002D21C2DB|nr:uncharacterized protein LOC133836049 [Drosophila sulfurigaster albostrigata]
MRASFPFAGLLLLLGFSLALAAQSLDETASALLPLEARNADVSGEDDVISTSYVLPNQIFNDGKPYYARQDPISGQLDFTAKKPAGIEPEVNEVLNSKEKIVLNGGSSPNIHDFLNLPVKYSSSKFVYPLVSSSYANLKYQGSNKNYVTNKKPTSVAAPVTVTAPPRYSGHNDNYLPVTTTKLTAVTPTEAGYFSSSSTRATTPRTTPSTTRSTTTTTTSTTPSTTTVRYTTTTRRTAPTVAATTAVPPTPRQQTTRKKFVPFKKTSPSTTAATSTTTTTTTIPTKLTKPTLSSSDVKFTTHHPTPQAAIFPTEPATTTKRYTSSTTAPVVFTEESITSTTPRIEGNRVPQLEPADVYHTLGQKINKQELEQEQQQQQQLQQQHQHQQQQQQQHQQQLHQQQQQEELHLQPPAKPALTLSDIFNSLAEEEVAVANNYQQNQGFDAQGNLIEPIAPSQPSPFAMQPQYPQHLQQQHQQQPQQPQPPQPPQQPPQRANPSQHPAEPQLISGSLENYGNEYVSYQVQQPNMMQYRPMPGQINNVVISPGQQSASFVLGSQQQVGHGNVEKEPLFSKDTAGVQYGQVINEDIANIKRPFPAKPTPPSSQQQMPSVQSNSKFQQTTDATVVGVPSGSYPEPPPEAPTPYQQLPLIGSNLRKKQPPKVLDTISASNNQLIQSSVPAPKPAAASPLPQDTQELLVSTNIRFPANDEESIEQSSPGVLPGPPAGPSINGHAQPLSLQQIQHANPVVFPKLSEEQQAGSANVQIQQHEVLNINQHKQQLTFPAPGQPQSNQEPSPAPSQDMQPPPPRYAPQQQSQAAPGKRPFYKEFDRKQQPPTGGAPTGPRPNVNLPNILPQFRPNAKLSNGHNPNLKQEPGNIRLNYNPSTPPQFAHRRQPLQQQQMQKRYPMNRISEYGPTNPALDINRRVYRLPPNGVQRMVPQMRDRLYVRRPNLPGLPNVSSGINNNVPSGPPRAVDGYPVERHAPAPVAEAYKLNPGDLDDFEEEDLVINDPPQAPNKERQTPSESKLEAVVTLQMLQSQKKPVNGDDTGAGEIQVTADNDPQEVLAGSIYGEEAIPSEAIRDPSAPAVEYQNTPFSVIRDQPQEPILKNKKPQSLQQQTKVQQQQLPKQKFPYAIEKPDPSYSELHPAQAAAAPQVPGVLIAPRIINSAFSSGTEAPIAIAYTPTEPNVAAYRRPQEAHPAAETQTEQVLSNDFDLRGHNYEKNFMAPFYPSASLGGAPNLGSPTPSNWKIVGGSTGAADPSIYEKNSINRADVDQSPEEKKEVQEASNSTDFTTEKHFELDSFQPQLQGGFKPIYPPDYLVNKDESNDQSDEQKKPLALALTAAQQPQTAQILSTGVITSSSSSSSSSSVQSTTVDNSRTSSSTTSTTNVPQTTKLASTTTTTTTSSTSNAPSSAPTKKSSFETSLAALLFGEDDDYEDGARKAEAVKTVTKEQRAPSGPRNVARMGPRSMRS